MKILFVGNDNETSYSEFLPLANYLRNKGKYDSFFLLNTNPSSTLLKKITDNNFVSYSLKKSKKVGLVNNDNIGKKNKITYAKKIFPKIIIEFVLFAKYFKSQYQIKKFTYRVLKREKPSLIITYGDRGAGTLGSSMRFAQTNNIPVIDLQIATTDLKFLLSNRIRNKRYHQGVIDKILDFIYNREYKIYKGRKLVFNPWYIFFARKLLNIYPSNPWNSGDSYCDLKLLVSKEEQMLIKSQGGRIDNSIIVGQLSHDYLYHSFLNAKLIKSKLVEKYFNTKLLNKQLVVLGAPQFYEHNIMSKECSKNEIKYIVDILSKFQSHIFLWSLHPKMNFGDYVWINELSNNNRILESERLSEVLGASDYYITMFKSTIQWAILCESKPIVLDYYGLDFDFSSFKSLVKLSEKSNLETDLKHIFLNTESNKSQIRIDKIDVSTFDGLSGSRILDAIENCVKIKNGK